MQEQQAIDIREVAELLGFKELEIYKLRRQIVTLQQSMEYRPSESLNGTEDNGNSTERTASAARRRNTG